MKWLTNIFNKEVTWLKINKWDVNLFWWSSDLLYFRFNVFQYKMSRFLQFWCKLNTSRIVKTCPFRFPRDYYGNSLHVIFPQFPNHYLPCFRMFPLVLLRFPRVFLLFPLSVSPVSYFRFCKFLMLQLILFYQLKDLMNGFFKKWKHL